MATFEGSTKGGRGQIIKGRWQVGGNCHTECLLEWHWGAMANAVMEGMSEGTTDDW